MIVNKDIWDKGGRGRHCGGQDEESETMMVQACKVKM